MAVNVDIQKGGSEGSGSVVRRFTKRVQTSGVLPRARSLRFFERPKSEATKKRRALKSIEKRAHYEKMAKLGKPVQSRGRRGR